MLDQTRQVLGEPVSPGSALCLGIGTRNRALKPVPIPSESADSVVRVASAGSHSVCARCASSVRGARRRVINQPAK
ncbi:RCC1-like domain-containing protein [Nocardia sp. NPDC050175]|uniref:RCC1-like domain-containing protein n=1 Tax=Nocardia sp. NPDC050175 TaxID=3364317 RepID=UPI00378EF9F4